MFFLIVVKSGCYSMLLNVDFDMYRSRMKMKVEALMSEKAQLEKICLGRKKRGGREKFMKRNVKPKRYLNLCFLKNLIFF